MSKQAKTAFLVMVALFGAAAPSFAQHCDLRGNARTALRNPLIWGATSTAPLDVAPEGQPPPIGDGCFSPPVTPGHAGMYPTAIPSVPATPANDIQYPSFNIGHNPYDLSAPGEYGASTWAPPPPDTPGEDPGIIHAPQDYYPPPAGIGVPLPGGGIAGEASDQRWGGQTSQDFGPYRHRGTKSYEFGTPLNGTPSEDGLNHARYNAKRTEDRYGNRFPIRNNDQQIVQTIAPY